MKNGLISLAAGLLIVLAPQAFAKPVESELQSKEDKAGYALGIELGEAFKSQGLDVRADKLAAGIIDAYQGKEYKMSREEISTVLVAFRKEQIAKQEGKMKQIAMDNAALGEKYMAKNAKEKGVETTASGIQYKVITAGKGKKPVATDLVEVNYEGKFLDGKVFDSSYKRGKPAQFRLNQVIAGWTEALQMMAEGSTWELVIPAALAYGENGMGGIIGPNETLIFKVELIRVNPA